MKRIKVRSSRLTTLSVLLGLSLTLVLSLILTRLPVVKAATLTVATTVDSEAGDSRAESGSKHISDFSESAPALGVPPFNFWLGLPNNGLNGPVFALASSGNDLYVGGRFTQTIDGKVKNLNNIAKFNLNLNTWSALPNNGLSGGSGNGVFSLGVIGNDLYVGGGFSQTADGAVKNLNNIAKFSGGAWSALPHNGLNGQVFALASSGSDLYVGGSFGQTGDCLVDINNCFMTNVKNLNGIAKFSGGAWSALPDKGMCCFVEALAFSGSDLYVGGSFDQTADCSDVPQLTCVKNLGNIAKFSGGAWSPLPNKGLGPPGRHVRSLAVSGSDLYVGGEFTQTADGGVTLNKIAKYSGGAWSALPNNGLDSTVWAIAVSGSDLYVGGGFNATADGAVRNLNSIAKFGTTSNTWSALPNNGLDGTVLAFAGIGSDLYMGGQFINTRDGVVKNLNFIAKLTNDTDGDSIPDEWERNGVTIDDVKIDLPSMGADPLHKDLFVHADWMDAAGLKPDAPDLKIISDSFENAPLANPDGTTGVHLHVDLGLDSVMNPVTGATWGALSNAGSVPYSATIGSTDAGGYNWTDTDNIKVNFNTFKRGAVFHYVCFCSKLGGLGKTSGVSRGFPAHDFLVTLGGWPVFGGTSLQKAGTFMHEFGHNLGLRHGGGDDVQYKPNFLSVMNYSFQTVGLLTPSGSAILRNFDYSRRRLPMLDETALVESAGISDPDGHLTFWNIMQANVQCLEHPDDYYRVFAYPATDWFCNLRLTPDPVKADVNGDGLCIGPGANRVLDTAPSGDDLVIGRFSTAGPNIIAGFNRKCETAAAGDDKQLQAVGFQQQDQLTSFDDWSAVRFDGGGQIGRLPAPPSVQKSIEPNDAITTPVDEPTYEQISEFVPPALFNAEATAPIDVVSYNPSNGSAQLVVSFDGRASTTPTGTITSWNWSFGDGVVGSGPTITHTYTAPGTYFATLSVTNSNGNVNLVPLRRRVTVGSASSTPTPTPTPMPSLVTVDGKVLTSDSRGLRNATVSITDSQGVVLQTATTSSFGFFSFANVITGQAYAFRVSSRLFRFSPQIVQVNGNLTLPDFVGLE